MKPSFVDRKLCCVPTATRIFLNPLDVKYSTSNVVGVETKAIANMGRSNYVQGDGTKA
jgi:hypothetical protein